MIDDWLNEEKVPAYPLETPKEIFKKKFINIPTLDDYSKTPGEKFWENFPKRKLPYKASTRINAKNLEKFIVENKKSMSYCERKRASRVVHDLRYGASACQREELPPITVHNDKSAIENGEMLTDKIAGWIESGFVAGPFDTPPVPGFRANPLMAVVRNNKVRPVLNMSGPKNKSFNDNVDKNQLEKVKMDSAKVFGYKLREMGKKAVFSKFDFCDAYKSIPAKTRDYRLQGFKWLGKYFVEVEQTFGGIPSVCNFDREGGTIKLLATLVSSIPRSLVLRILDDTSCISAQGDFYARDFGLAMKDICRKINMPLAKNCEKKEKAFEREHNGTVMGITFDSIAMAWAMP